MRVNSKAYAVYGTCYLRSFVFVASYIILASVCLFSYDNQNNFEHRSFKSNLKIVHMNL